MQFEWDAKKEALNIKKHGIDFDTASRIFDDPVTEIKNNLKHSIVEERFYAIGNLGGRTLTVRFTVRGEKIRIIGAGYGDWSK